LALGRYDAGMPRTALRWDIPSHDTYGPLLEAAIAAMNAHGPFTADDPEVESAPRWAALVDGKFRVVSPASFAHAQVIALLAADLIRRLGGRGSAAAHAPVRTSRGRTVREADIAVYVGLVKLEQSVPFPDIVPDLIIEVLSAGTEAEDRIVKKAEYAAIAVKEYVLVDPRDAHVEIFALRARKYVAVRRGREGWPSKVLGEAWDPAAVLPSR
jgi:Uma2 family endonuclease